VVRGGAPYPTIDREMLLALDPQVIVQLLPDASPQVRAAAGRVWQGLPQLQAVRNGRVHVILHSWSLSPTQHVAELAELFEKALADAREERKVAPPTTTTSTTTSAMRVTPVHAAALSDRCHPEGSGSDPRDLGVGRSFYSEVPHVASAPFGMTGGAIASTNKRLATPASFSGRSP
jgi:hypothetical protein